VERAWHPFNALEAAQDRRLKGNTNHAVVLRAGSLARLEKTPGFGMTP
jgi:hypothetical protein